MTADSHNAYRRTLLPLNAASPVLREGWTFRLSEAGAFALPCDVPRDGWLDAQVPGTVAQNLSRHGLWDFENPERLETRDYWFRRTLEGSGDFELRFDGLATLAEVYLDGALVLVSDNMFHAHRLGVTLNGAHDLALCFRALEPVLNLPRKRARWRPRAVQPQGLRYVRTSLLGHMPGWCPPVEPVGPWRDIALVPAAALHVERLISRLDSGDGIVSFALSGLTPGASVIITFAEQSLGLRANEDGALAHDIKVKNPKLWWPHTHGEPYLYEVRAQIDGAVYALGRVGFREVTIDRGADGKGFGFVINGVPIFARGACWTSADLIGLSSSRDTYAPHLNLMRDASMNMVRVGGTNVYEGDAFYELCDELGLLVWQDFMFSNFDYPAQDEAFAASVKREADEFLTRTQAHPCIAIFCGGSEVAQQAAMFGLPASTWSNVLFDTLLPERVAQLRNDVPYVPNTPMGGPLPFVPGEGLCHYYGVSAYMRPLNDARLANVRFAPETLCFAHVPDGADVALEPDAPSTVQRDWTPRVAGDTGAIWYFEGVRNFYTHELYGVDVDVLARENPEHFLAMARATTAEVMAHVFGEWRRAGSSSRGGLVWNFQDLWPGAGWGILDVTGRPKSAYYALKRAFKPVQVVLSDEGLNGLDVHLINETAEPRKATLHLACLQNGVTPVMQSSREVELAPRSSQVINATELWGAFFDTSYAYRFGPPAHDVTIGRLSDESGEIAQAFHFPQGRSAALREAELSVELGRDDASWFLDVKAQYFAQSVSIHDPLFMAEDNWFHLPPQVTRRIRLHGDCNDVSRPKGYVRALNSPKIPYSV